ncbi:MAG TPA: hypothetical protein PLP33_29170 [Leptospiraceae bacterium]|nr:hypothetical protein [Leptospiraceae bacterium]
MTPERHKELIEDFFDNVKKDILERAEKFPPHWNGIQIRQYIEDFVRERYGSMKLSKKELSDYRNDVYNNNL